MRITLEIRRTLDLEALPTRRRLFLYRLWARVRFQLTSGWSEPHVAIVDTGAPYSVIPASLSPPLRTERLKQVPLRGIVPGKAAEVEAVLARVHTRLLDARTTSPRLSLWAMLVNTDHMPLILGWAGCLDRAKLTLDAQRNTAWLEF